MTTADRDAYLQGRRAGRLIAGQSTEAARRSIRRDYLIVARHSSDRPYLLGLARGLGR